MGRPKLPDADRLNHCGAFRMTNAERSKLARFMERNGHKSVSDAIRALIRRTKC